jgi:hypothetical protein
MKYTNIIIFLILSSHLVVGWKDTFTATVYVEKLPSEEPPFEVQDVNVKVDFNLKSSPKMPPGIYFSFSPKKQKNREDQDKLHYSLGGLSFKVDIYSCDGSLKKCYIINEKYTIILMFKNKKVQQKDNTSDFSDWISFHKPNNLFRKNFIYHPQPWNNEKKTIWENMMPDRILLSQLMSAYPDLGEGEIQKLEVFLEDCSNSLANHAEKIMKEYKKPNVEDTSESQFITMFLKRTTYPINKLIKDFTEEKSESSGPKDRKTIYKMMSSEKLTGLIPTKLTLSNVPKKSDFLSRDPSNELNTMIKKIIDDPEVKSHNIINVVVKNFMNALPLRMYLRSEILNPVIALYLTKTIICEAKEVNESFPHVDFFKILGLKHTQPRKCENTDNEIFYLSYPKAYIELVKRYVHSNFQSKLKIILNMVDPNHQILFKK